MSGSIPEIGRRCCPLTVVNFALACAISCAMCGFAQGASVTDHEWELLEILKLDPVIAEVIKPNAQDSQLRKLQKEVCFSLTVYMATMEKLIAIGKWNPQDFSEMIRVSVSLPNERR